MVKRYGNRVGRKDLWKYVTDEEKSSKSIVPIRQSVEASCRLSNVEKWSEVTERGDMVRIIADFQKSDLALILNRSIMQGYCKVLSALEQGQVELQWKRFVQVGWVKLGAQTQGFQRTEDSHILKKMQSNCSEIKIFP